MSEIEDGRVRTTMISESTFYRILKGNWGYLAILFAFSSFFVLVFSTSTSPLYPYPDTSDSFIFQVIGKEWLEGAVPYRDLYDNKGPFLYAMNAMGYWLLGNRSGVLLVQLAFLFSTAIVTFRFLRMGFTKRCSLWLTLVLIAGLSLGYNGGNNASEYALPFIMYAFYLFYSWLQKDTPLRVRATYTHDVFYGVALGICLMTRPSNGLVVGMIIGCMAIYHLKNRQIKRLASYIVAVTVGILSVCLPFAVYFTAKGCLDDFYYATIESNIHYLKNTGLFNSPMFFKRAVALICSYANCMVFPILGLLLICTKNKNWKNGVIWLVMGVVCLLFFARTNCYPNYAHICLPFAVIGLLELKSAAKALRANRLRHGVSVAIAVWIVGVNTWNISYMLVKNAMHDDSPQKLLYAAYDALLGDMPEEGRSSFASYECLPEILLRWDIRPRYRFFALQGFSLNYNADVYAKTNDEFAHGDAQWLMVNYWKDVPAKIRSTLNDRYTSVKSISEGENHLVLYKKIKNFKKERNNSL